MYIRSGMAYKPQALRFGNKQVAERNNEARLGELKEAQQVARTLKQLLALKDDDIEVYNPVTTERHLYSTFSELNETGLKELINRKKTPVNYSFVISFRSDRRPEYNQIKDKLNQLPGQVVPIDNSPTGNVASFKWTLPNTEEFQHLSQRDVEIRCEYYPKIPQWALDPRLPQNFE